MIEEENQPENFSPQTEYADSATADVKLSVEPDSEAQVDASSQTYATSAEVWPTQASGENVSTTAAEATSAAPLNDSAATEGLMREVEALRAQLEERANQCDSLKNQYMRIAADFENFRRRTLKEKEDLEVQVKCATISELLSVVDNFERARSHLKPQTDGEMTIHKSYQSVYKQLVDSLKRLGVSPMRPEGKEFDPNLHEAVMRQPTDEYPEGAVMEELVRGYFLGDRVLRHAMVKVAAAAEPVVTSDESNSGTTET